ncbi:MAG: hypothetical protein PHI63_06540 [Patescibacteria group bacterium]|nr:hypothetical protein [Patescibacteria group bacterium]
MNLKFFRRGKHKRQAKHRRIHLSPKVIYLVTMLILASGLGASMYLEYRLVDQTLSASDVIIRLRPEVTEETFSAEEFLGAISLMDKKTNQPEPADWAAIVNPFATFRPITTTATPATNATGTPP